MNEWIELLSSWLLRTSVEGTILIAAVLGLSWTLGRHLGPRWRVILWTLVGMKLLVPAFVPSTPGLGNWLRTESTPKISEPVFTEITEIQESFGFEEKTAAPIPMDLPSVVKDFPDKESERSIKLILFYAWLTGALGIFVTMFVRQLRFLSAASRSSCRDRRLLALVREVAKELGVSRDIRVLLSAEGSTPAVFGAWRSCLMLPADWETRFDTGSLRHILMHEIEHIRYRDVLWNWVAAAVNAIHWFNPFVWVAVSRFQSDRELRCDAGTVSRLQPDERIAYGQTLLRVQKEFIAAPTTAGVAPCVRNHPTLHQRILMITNPTDKKNWLNAILALGVAGLISFSFGSASADDERSTRESSRDGERSAEREGARDGERSAERESSRDGDRRSAEREGSRDGERSAEREGARDGEGSRSREGARDGDRPREGEGSRSREGARDGERSSSEVGLSSATLKELNQLARIYRAYDKDSNDEVTFKEWVAMKNYELTRDQEKREKGWFDDADADNDDSLTVEEFQQWKLVQKYPAMREGEGSRDGDRPREGSRDGDRPREGTRDGDKPSREGARDGDRPREGARDGDQPRREGARDGDQPSREGARDGDRPREGARDGDQPRREGARDGDQPSREGARDGDRPREGARDGDQPRREGARDGDQPSREGAGDGDRPREGSREGDQPRREGARDGDS